MCIYDSFALPSPSNDIYLIYSYVHTTKAVMQTEIQHFEYNANGVLFKFKIVINMFKH